MFLWKRYSYWAPQESLCSYGTQKFITIFVKVKQWTLHWEIVTKLTNITKNTLFISSSCMSLKVVPKFGVFWPKILYAFRTFPKPHYIKSTCILKYLYTGDYSESKLRWAVNKTSNEEKIITYKKYVNTTRHFSYRRIRLYIPVSRKSAACELRHVLTPSINTSLLLKSCDRN
jgi:hypothetical protein